MAGLKDYRYKFNTTTILFPLTWQESFNTIDDVQISEAGGDLVTVSRYGKLSVSAGFKCTSAWVKTFQGFMDEPSFTLHRYDAFAERYKMHTVRMREFSCNFVPKSQDLSITKGIWEVSFVLEEC